MKLSRDGEIWSLDRLTHFDCKGRPIDNALVVWGHPDISAKFALIQEIRLCLWFDWKIKEEINWEDLLFYNVWALHTFTPIIYSAVCYCRHSCSLYIQLQLCPPFCQCNGWWILLSATGAAVIPWYWCEWIYAEALVEPAWLWNFPEARIWKDTESGLLKHWCWWTYVVVGVLGVVGVADSCGVCW